MYIFFFFFCLLACFFASILLFFVFVGYFFGHLPFRIAGAFGLEGSLHTANALSGDGHTLHTSIQKKTTTTRTATMREEELPKATKNGITMDIRRILIENLGSGAARALHEHIAPRWMNSKVRARWIERERNSARRARWDRKAAQQEFPSTFAWKPMWPLRVILILFNFFFFISTQKQPFAAFVVCHNTFRSDCDFAGALKRPALGLFLVNSFFFSCSSPCIHFRGSHWLLHFVSVSLSVSPIPVYLNYEILIRTDLYYYVWWWEDDDTILLKTDGLIVVCECSGHCRCSLLHSHSTILSFLLSFVLCFYLRYRRSIVR